MMTVLLAAAKKITSFTEFFQSSRGQWAALAIAVIAMFGFVFWLKRWWQNQELEKHSAERMLMEFREIHRQGKLTADEYQGIRERLLQKTDQSGGADNTAHKPSAGDSAENPSGTPD